MPALVGLAAASRPSTSVTSRTRQRSSNLMSVRFHSTCTPGSSSVFPCFPPWRHWRRLLWIGGCGHVGLLSLHLVDLRCRAQLRQGVAHRTLPGERTSTGEDSRPPQFHRRSRTPPGAKDLAVDGAPLVNNRINADVCGETIPLGILLRASVTSW